jgi:hypothetical protein
MKSSTASWLRVPPNRAVQWVKSRFGVFGVRRWISCSNCSAVIAIALVCDLVIVVVVVFFIVFFFHFFTTRLRWRFRSTTLRGLRNRFFFHFFHYAVFRWRFRSATLRGLRNRFFFHFFTTRFRWRFRSATLRGLRNRFFFHFFFFSLRFVTSGLELGASL